MSQATNTSHQPTMRQAYILYDPADGGIVRIHHAEIFSGGKQPTESDMGVRAFDFAKRAGRETVGLEVLHAPGGHLRAGNVYKGDPSSRTLMEVTAMIGETSPGA